MEDSDLLVSSTLSVVQVPIDLKEPNVLTSGVDWSKSNGLFGLLEPGDEDATSIQNVESH